MTTDKVPEPYHCWAANEGLDAPKAFSMKDRCLSCGVKRMSHLTGGYGVKSDAVAAGPCPKSPWRDLPEDDIKRYLINYIDEPQTQTQREMLQWAQS